MKKNINADFKLGIIGLGYVGLPLVTFASNKTKVVGFDIDESKLKILKVGKSYIKQIDNGKIKSLF